MFGPMFHTYILSQVFGLYLTIMAVIMLSRMRYYRNLLSHMSLDTPGLVFGASFSLLLGLFLIVVHNIWVMEPRVVVTILAWIIFIKSILWLAFPEKMIHVSRSIYEGPAFFVIIAILFILGIFLLTKGFYLYIPAEHLPLK